MSTNPAQQDRYHFLDGIRGIAASMIVLHHAFSSNIAAALTKMHLHALGFLLQTVTGSGVNLFFVLSGVVLLRPYLRGQRKFKTLDYFWRRLKRIYPPTSSLWHLGLGSSGSIPTTRRGTTSRV
jgi:peptidoglycan/LPS O-acetylase OafA/YrhL